MSATKAASSSLQKMMTSYLFSTAMLLLYDTSRPLPNLLYLIWLGLRAFALKVDHFFNTRFSKDVMAPTCTL